MFASRILAGTIALIMTSSAATAEDKVYEYKYADGDVKLFVPQESAPMKGILLSVAHADLRTEGRWAEFCRQQHFGHMFITINLKASNRPMKIQQAMMGALKEFAAKYNRPELLNVPLTGTGHSAGGMVAGVLLKTPERAITYCIDCSWVVDSTKYDAEAKHVPALFTMGAIPDAFKMLPAIDAHWVPARKEELPWGLGVQWDCAHNFGQSATLFIPWVTALIELRVPADADAVKDPVKLRDVKLADGWLGDRSTTDSNFAAIAPYKDYKGDRAAAVWLPNAKVAHVWRAYQSKKSPLTLEGAPPDGSAKLPPFDPKKSRDLTVNPGSDVILSAGMKQPLDVRKIQFFDGDKLLGEATAAPWSFEWKQPAQGPHPIYAQWTAKDGTVGVTNPALVVVRAHAAAK